MIWDHRLWILVPLCAASCAPPEPRGPASVYLRMNADSGGDVYAVAPGDELHTGDYVELWVDVDRPAYVYVVEFFADGTKDVLFPQRGDVKVLPGKPTRIPAGEQWLKLDPRVGEEHLYVIASAAPLAQVDRAIKSKVDQIRLSGATPSRPPPSPAPPSTPTPAQTSQKEHAAPPAVAPSEPLKPAATKPMRRPPHKGPVKPRGLEADPLPGKLDPFTRGDEPETRGFVTVQKDGTLSGRADPAGLTVMRFWIRHVQ